MKQSGHSNHYLIDSVKRRSLWRSHTMFFAIQTRTGRVAGAAATAGPMPPTAPPPLKNSPPSTHSPRHPPRSQVRWVPLLLLIASGCGKPPSADDLYRQAENLRRRGYAKQAVEVADRGWRQWMGKPGDEWHWKFRLLKAE